MGRWDRPENVLRDLMDSEGGEPKDSAASRRVWLQAEAALRGGRANRIRAALIAMMWDSGGEPRDDRWSRAVWKRAYAAVGGEQMFRSPEKRRRNPSRAVNLIPSPYYHESKRGKDIVAGYGIWDTVASDWVIADGYPTRDAAADAIHLISARVKGGYGLIATVRAEQARVKRRWRGVPHTNCSVCKA